MSTWFSQHSQALINRYVHDAHLPIDAPPVQALRTELESGDGHGNWDSDDDVIRVWRKRCSDYVDTVAGLLESHTKLLADARWARSLTASPKVYADFIQRATRGAIHTETIEDGRRCLPAVHPAYSDGAQPLSHTVVLNGLRRAQLIGSGVRQRGRAQIILNHANKGTLVLFMNRGFHWYVLWHSSQAGPTTRPYFALRGL
jgi:hypothetical protein